MKIINTRLEIINRRHLKKKKKEKFSMKNIFFIINSFFLIVFIQFSRKNKFEFFDYY